MGTQEKETDRYIPDGVRFHSLGKYEWMIRKGMYSGRNELPIVSENGKTSKDEVGNHPRLLRRSTKGQNGKGANLKRGTGDMAKDLSTSAKMELGQGLADTGIRRPGRRKNIFRMARRVKRRQPKKKHGKQNTNPGYFHQKGK